MTTLYLFPYSSVAGVLSLHSIIPRLPFASNHLGISEDTSVALLCCLMELFDENSDNARSAVLNVT